VSYRVLLAQTLVMMMVDDDDDDDDDEPSYAEEADALLAQMRQLRESMQQESGTLQQKAQASEQVRTSAQRNLGRTVASIVDDVANMPSLMVDVANGRWADAELQPALAAIVGARSVGPSVAGSADGPSDANSQIEAELARRRAMAGAAQAQAQPPSGHCASSSPPPARPSPPAARQPGAGAKGGKAPRFATKPGGAEAARADHISKVRGAPAVQGTAGAASDISRLASRPLPYVANKPRPAGAWGSLRHDLALKAASGEPAGRRLCATLLSTVGRCCRRRITRGLRPRRAPKERPGGSRRRKPRDQRFPCFHVQ